ncbi:hypothetical protein GJ496_011965 [Pomphorhynchus laevis]|nr:hypothetical protein GJ496_011965 [Pomphorhynchus laevis]
MRNIFKRHTWANCYPSYGGGYPQTSVGLYPGAGGYPGMGQYPGGGYGQYPGTMCGCFSDDGYQKKRRCTIQ